MVKTVALLAARRRRALGALQARPRPRPHPRRRGAGHQPAPMAGDPARWPRSSSPARAPAHASRTLFAVGDEKQSIYLLPGRGAGLVRAHAARARRRGARRAGPPGPTSSCTSPSARCRWCWRRSTRSSPRPEVHRGLSRRAAADRRTARRRHGEPGRVVLWPTIAPPTKTEPEDWATPARPARRERARRCSSPSASPRPSRGWLDRGERLECDAAQPIRAGDILILVAQRGALDRRHQPRAEDAAACRSPAPTGCTLDRAHRGHGPDGARPRGAAARGRPVAGRPPQEPADRPRARTQLFDLAHGRKGVAVGCARRARRRTRARLRRGARRGSTLARAWPTRATRTPSTPASSGRDGGRGGVPRAGSGAEAEDVLDEFLAQALAYRAGQRAVAGGLPRLAGGGRRPRSSATPRRCATRCA